MIKVNMEIENLKSFLDLIDEIGERIEVRIIALGDGSYELYVPRTAHQEILDELENN